MTTNDPLYAIQREKRRLRKELQTSRQLLSEQMQHIFSPMPSKIGKVQRVTSLISNGWAVFEGMRIGMSVIRATRKVFRRR